MADGTNFIFKNDVVTSASTKYGEAVATFDEAANKLEAALKSVVWDDAAAQQWNEKTGLCLAKIKEMSGKLKHNSDVLKSMAQAASSLQQTIQNEISTKIYNG